MTPSVRQSPPALVALWSCAFSLLMAAVAPGCSPRPAAVSPGVGDQTIDAHLLLSPTTDGESLLGRAVQRTPDGAWTIAEARAPGCEVQVRRREGRYHTRRSVEVRDLTTLAGGYGGLVRVEGRHGRVSSADLDLENVATLVADTRGPCGETVVTEVLVGHGSRKLLAEETTAGAVEGGVVARGSAAHERAARTVDELAWSDDQAYAFRYASGDKSQPLGLTARLPAEVREGDDVTVTFEADRPAYLIVYYIDAQGRGDVLWPSDDESAPQIEPGKPATLPSARERSRGVSLRARLTKPGARERETLVVYALTERADFDRLRPGAGGNDPDGAAYAARLSAQLAELPLRRWSRVLRGYSIAPR